jgi:hypothetical protein
MCQGPSRRAIAAVIALAAAVLAPSGAAADDAMRVSVDWDKLGGVLHESASSLVPRESWHAEVPDQAHGASVPRWFGTSPSLALVARDWGVSQLLWGHLTVADQLRLSRSSRMVVSRLRLAGGRLAPFAQLGVGQWRVDTSVVPSLPSDVALAGQVGGGLEMQVSPRAAIALQGDCTLLYREGREPTSLAARPLWGTLLAARARF